MIATLKRQIRKAVLGYDISNYFFSQAGEDAILQAIFSKKLSRGEKGFFVDVGAYHPYKGSNTYLLYINKWRGINIDARPGSMKEFNKIRPEDINIEGGVSDKTEDLTYYLIDDNSPMNSFSKENLLEIGMFKHVKKEISIRVLPLKEILNKYSERFDHIDLLNIDVEGLDLKVLKSNDWIKYRPDILIVELNCRDIQDLMNNESAIYLSDLGYKIIAKNIILPDIASVFFAHKDFQY